MGANLERYSVASIKKTLADGKKLPDPSEVSWLVEDKSAVVAYDEQSCAVPGDPAPPAQHEWHVAEPLASFADVDYPFEEFPQQVAVQRRRRPGDQEGDRPKSPPCAFFGWHPNERQLN